MIGKTLQRHGRSTLVVILLALAALAAGCAGGRGERGTERGARQWTPPASLAALTADVQVRDFEWHDEQRNRSVPARLYLPPLQSTPAVAGTVQQLPLVVFSHGLGGSRFGYSHLGRYWASQGIMTLHLQHAGSDRSVWRGQGLGMLNALWSAASQDEAIARVHDVTFALDQTMAQPDLASLIDLRRIGVAGHSFGANTALLAVGARFREGERVMRFADPRIRAAVILSPPSIPSSQDPAFVYSGVTVPTLHLTGTNDVTPIPGLSTTAEERRIPFDSMAATPRYLGIFNGGRHSMFNDYSRDEVAEAIKASSRELTLAFWRAVFMDDVQARSALRSTTRSSPGMAALFDWESRP